MGAARDESEWRRLAEEIRPVLPGLLEDDAEAAALERELARVLALPLGKAKAELRRLLTRHPRTRRWLRERDERPGAGYRSAPGAPVRSLEVAMAERIPVGRRVPMFVRIVLGARDGVTPLKPLDIPPQGARVTVSVSAPTLVPVSDLDQDLTVPAAADSEPVRFGFVARTAGPHAVTVMAFRGGTYLGGASIEVSADDEAVPQDETVRSAGLPSVAATCGEVTLQVTRQGSRYQFQLISDALHQPQRTGRLSADPREVVERLVRELGAMASGETSLDSPALVRRRLQALGLNLWRDLVPQAVHDQFWSRFDRITSLTIVSHRDTVPWELLYPLDGGREAGFLAERVPVVRKFYEQPRTLRLAVPRATYVVPPRSGPEYAREVADVRARLSGVADGGVIEDLDDLLRLLDQGPVGVVHYTGHHDFSTAEGPAIALNGGRFRLVDMDLPAQRRSWTGRPVVFLNGCRTAGQAPELMAVSGWADRFVRAGAGVFVGSLWAVRSSSAARFADHFYEGFHERGLTLGEASRDARQAIKEEAGDPTWLAYSVYGDPGATVAGR